MMSVSALAKDISDTETRTDKELLPALKQSSEMDFAKTGVQGYKDLFNNLVVLRICQKMKMWMYMMYM